MTASAHPCYGFGRPSRTVPPTPRGSPPSCTTTAHSAAATRDEVREPEADAPVPERYEVGVVEVGVVVGGRRRQVLIPGIGGICGIRRRIGRARKARAGVRDRRERHGVAPRRKPERPKSREVALRDVELLGALADPRGDDVGIDVARTRRPRRRGEPAAPNAARVLCLASSFFWID